MAEATQVLLIEPFYGGSHKVMIDLLQRELSIPEANIFHLPAKKWHWRLRTSAVTFASKIPKPHNFKVLFATSMLNLSELIGIRPDLSSVRKILYFHENQIVYPVRKQESTDFQLGWIQFVSCLAADTVVFNSKYNMSSFLEGLVTFLNHMPDYRPKESIESIREKSRVLYFPVSMELGMPSDQDDVSETKEGPLRIVWPHRWEHDKNPELLFSVLLALVDSQVSFKVSILGECTSDIPKIFEESEKRLRDSGCLEHFGFMPSKESYYQVLKKADVVLSTANHEFFGVSVVEAIVCGCFPLCPKRLVYPEYLGQEYLYNTEAQLIKKLKRLSASVDWVRKKEWVPIDLSAFDWDSLKPVYTELLLGTITND